MKLFKGGKSASGIVGRWAAKGGLLGRTLEVVEDTEKKRGNWQAMGNFRNKPSAPE